MVWKVVKSAQPPVRYRRNSDRRPDIVKLSIASDMSEKGRLLTTSQLQLQLQLKKLRRC